MGRAQRGAGGKLPQSWYGSAQLRHDKLFEPVAWVVVDMVALAEVAYADGDVGHALGSGGVVNSEWVYNGDYTALYHFSDNLLHTGIQLCCAGTRSGQSSKLDDCTAMAFVRFAAYTGEGGLMPDDVGRNCTTSGHLGSIYRPSSVCEPSRTSCSRSAS